MPDTVSKKKRSQIMSKIRNKETNLELNFKELMKGLKFRYQPKVFGKPDFASKKLKIAVFVDSCFWHKCPKCYIEPKSNKKYWLPKIEKNVKRDKINNRLLKKDGWKIIRIWQHDIENNFSSVFRKIEKELK